MIGIVLPGVNDIDVNNHLNELKMLAKTASVKTLSIVTQRLQKVNPLVIFLQTLQFLHEKHVLDLELKI